MKPIIIGGPEKLIDYSKLSTEEAFLKCGNNTGNLVFRYAISQHLGRSVPRVSWSSKSSRVHALGDVAIMPCANQLGAHADCKSRADLTESLQIPAIALGLGAQATLNQEFPDLPADVLRWVRAISDKRTGNKANISVRGEFSRRVLENVGIRDGVEVLGCPSLFINESRCLGKDIERKSENNPRRIAVAAGSVDHAALEACLYGISQKSGGEYIVQHPLPFVKMARNEGWDISPSWRERLSRVFGVRNSKELLTYSPGNVRSYFDVDAWVETLRKHDFVIGTRIHGTALALQSGIPALCLIHDTRTRELCETMQIPFVDSSRVFEHSDPKGFLWHEFINQFNPTDFDRNRILLASKTLSIFKSYGIAASSQLSNLCGTVDGGHIVS